jgi:hypothetical protein
VNSHDRLLTGCLAGRTWQLPGPAQAPRATAGGAALPGRATATDL